DGDAHSPDEGACEQAPPLRRRARARALDADHAVADQPATGAGDEDCEEGEDASAHRRQRRRRRGRVLDRLGHGAGSYARLVRALIVLPTYEEAANVVEVLRRVRAAAPGADVLVV